MHTRWEESEPTAPPSSLHPRNWASSQGASNPFNFTGAIAAHLLLKQGSRPSRPDQEGRKGSEEGVPENLRVPLEGDRDFGERCGSSIFVSQRKKFQSLRGVTENLLNLCPEEDLTIFLLLLSLLYWAANKSALCLGR